MIIDRYDIYIYICIMYIYRVDQKKGDLNKHCHSYSEIHQKGKKLVCFGKLGINAARYAPNLSKLM